MDAEARDMMRKADKKLQGGFLAIFSGGPDYEGAIQLYQNAANKFKLSKQWPDAADCLVRCAVLRQKNGDQSQEATCYMEAANIMKKYSTSDAVIYYQKAVELMNTSGRFNQSAKMMKGVAEMFEADGNYLESAKFYKKAAEYFDMDDFGKSQYSACIIKYADFISKFQNHLEEAIKIYETEGTKALRNNLIQFGAKEHFLKAGILHLTVGDAINASVACDKYDEIDPRFAPSREGKLFRSLVTALTQQDLETFSAAISEFDSITPLDPWKVHFLFMVRKMLGESAGGPVIDESVDLVDNML